jgi:hypothetical protein
MSEHHERLKNVVIQALSELASDPETDVQDLLDIQHTATDFAFVKKYPAVVAERTDLAPAIPSNL